MKHVNRSTGYKKQAMELLKVTFKRLSVVSIRCCFEEKKCSFTETYNILSTINAVIGEENQELQRARILHDAPFLHAVNCLVTQAPRQPPRKRVLIDDKSLMEEVDAIPQMNSKEKRPSNIEEPLEDKKIGAKAAPMKEMLECGCCFGDVLFEDMCQCDEGHLFCKTCIQHYVEEQVFGKNASDIQCISSEGCTAGYSSTQLDRALPPKLRGKVDEHFFRVNVEQANMSDLSQCPKCASFLVLPDSVTILHCPRPECQHVSCRHCQEAPHLSKTCQEAKAEKERLSAHARAADAMTDAVVRKCPECSKSFVKEEGCNKMKCPSCGTLSCYLCRNKITAYEHFCQTPLCDHTSCGKCILFTNSEEDDKRARREACQKELQNAGAAASTVGGLLSPPEKTDRECPALEPTHPPNVNGLHRAHQDLRQPKARALLRPPPWLVPAQAPQHAPRPRKNAIVLLPLPKVPEQAPQHAPPHSPFQRPVPALWQFNPERPKDAPIAPQAPKKAPYYPPFQAWTRAKKDAPIAPQAPKKAPYYPPFQAWARARDDPYDSV